MYHLVWRYGKENRIIYSGTVQLCQIKRKELKMQPQYRAAQLIIRSEIGLKKCPNWTQKTKLCNK